jgi:hypothetical protein
MKARSVLHLAALAGILVLTAAAPALADEAVPPTAMWIQRNRMAWTGRSYSTSDEVVAHVHVFDATKAMVTEATVTAVWAYNGEIVCEATSVTGFQGIAEFRRNAMRGQYQICVTDVVKDRWQYDASQNHDSECSSINVW